MFTRERDLPRRDNEVRAGRDYRGGGEGMARSYSARPTRSVFNLLGAGHGRPQGRNWEEGDLRDMIQTEVPDKMTGPRARTTKDLA